MREYRTLYIGGRWVERAEPGEFGFHDYLEVKGILGYAPDETAS